MTGSGLERAWAKNAELVDFLLAGIPDAGLEARYSPRTRTVASQFAHLHNVRALQVAKRGPKGEAKLETFKRGAQPTRTELEEALASSAPAVGRMLAAAEAEDRVRAWKGPPASFLGYLCAHEGHHRGLVLVSLRLAGIRMPKTVTYGLWDGWRKEASTPPSA